MEAEATEDFELMAAMTPSDKPYSRTSAWDMWKRRVPWLMFLMLSATFTSMIINSFEDALAVQAVLIGFIPMLMGTGGNSGAQASTAVIRSIAPGDTEPEGVGRVIWKEFRVAILCGVTLAAVNFAKMLLVDRILFFEQRRCNAHRCRRCQPFDRAHRYVCKGRRKCAAHSGRKSSALTRQSWQTP